MIERGSGGDWILETTDEDIKQLYFSENINNWNYILDLGSHSVIVSNEASNNLYTCGNNQNMQLGLGDTFSLNSVGLFDASFNNKKVIGISCGYSHTVVITGDSSNNLYTCGSNWAGQLGLSDTIDKNNFPKCTTK